MEVSTISGIDEQNKDVPICSRCNERPRYWIAYSKQPFLPVWFYSNSYISTLPELYKKYKCAGIKRYLDAFTIFEKVRCVNCLTTLKYENEPQIFNQLQNAYSRYFPEQMYGTD